eukprot:snap_masked-scaffold427_size174323-processed-gene-0.23 protein:Tk04515 transcript:snap_masked-scaffold427_size174323-processed-gene-0.23-mRNA-1 annotation:"pseudouridine-5 -monophosphatase isoform x1"
MWRGGSALGAARSGSFPSVSHVIFDMDGLLLDTEPGYFQATNAILKRHGHAYSYDLKTQLMGQGPQECARVIIDTHHLPLTVEEYTAQMTARLKKVFPQSPWMSGALKLAHHFYKHGIPMAVATSSSGENYRLKTKHHSRMFEMFSHVITGDMVDKGKPEPDIYLRCIREFADPDLRPEHCLAFEDSPNGLQAATQAGLQCIMIPEPDIPEELQRAATLVLDSAHLFRPEQFGLPPFNYRPVTHVIFDMDGLLLDTNFFYNQSKGGRAVFQFYPENSDQIEMITSQSMRAGFSGGLVVDYPNSSKAKKYFLVLMTSSGGASMPPALGTETGSSLQVQNEGTRNRIRKARGKGLKSSKDWIQDRKDRRRRKGLETRPDSKFTGRKRAGRF